MSVARRQRTLFGLGRQRGRPHRYTVIRWSIGVVATVAVALLPLTDTLRIDLWSGRHAWMGREVGLVEALEAFAFPFLAVNVVIVIVSRFLGRWLCGFVCPVGNLNRLAEWLAWRHRRGVARHAARLALLVVCAALAAVVFAFWIDWRVFVEGTPAARAVAGAVLLVSSLSLYALVSGLGMRFCRDYCPSGVYFAVLGPTSATGIEFAHPETCTDCHACENVCPVDLKPREMRGAPRAGTGFYPDELTNFANCLRCGDCVVVCEETTEENTGPTPLRLGFLPPGARAGEEDET